MTLTGIAPGLQRDGQVIHLVTFENGTVVPGCGDWTRSPNWTTERRVATCHRCLLGLAAQPAACVDT